MLDDPAGILRSLFDAALDAVAPERCVRGLLVLAVLITTAAQIAAGRSGR